MDKTNMVTTPAIIGTEVRLTISRGFALIVPATMTTTAATGDTARIRLPHSPIGMDTAMAEIPAASASGTIKGTMA